jgi:hypothetical protein
MQAGHQVPDRARSDVDDKTFLALPLAIRHPPGADYDPCHMHAR